MPLRGAAEPAKRTARTCRRARFARHDRAHCAHLSNAAAFLLKSVRASRKMFCLCSHAGSAMMARGFRRSRLVGKGGLIWRIRAFASSDASQEPALAPAPLFDK